MRKGLGIGSGKKGYFNMMPKDPHVHSQSAKGIKQPCGGKSGSTGFLCGLNTLFMAQPDLHLAKNVDLNRYAGKWYQIAAKPAWFQSGCKNVTAEYVLQPDKTIRVINSCVKDGKKDVAYGVAIKTKQSGQLQVSFDTVPFISSEYNIIYTDYDTAMVGSSDRKFLWILSRRPTIDRAKYQHLVSRAKAQYFDVSTLRRT